MYVVILGCGRVGARLAGLLSASHRVTIIDWNEAAFDRLSSEYTGETEIGNGIDVETLRAARVPEADAFVALTNGDNRNLMAAQVAQLLGAKRSVVRVYDPVRSEIFSGAGLITVSPTVKGAQRLFDLAMVNGEAG